MKAELEPEDSGVEAGSSSAHDWEVGQGSARDWGGHALEQGLQILGVRNNSDFD